jgi:hypothetical protein
MSDAPYPRIGRRSGNSNPRRPLDPGAEAARSAERRVAMPGGPRAPRLGLLLLLPLLLPSPSAPGHRAAAGPRERAGRPGSPGAWPGVQRLREQLRAAAALSRRYWALVSCQVWPEHCEEDSEEDAGTPGKSAPAAPDSYLHTLPWGSPWVQPGHLAPPPMLPTPLLSPSPPGRCRSCCSFPLS